MIYHSSWYNALLLEISVDIYFHEKLFLIKEFALNFIDLNLKFLNQFLLYLSSDCIWCMLWLYNRKSIPVPFVFENFCSFPVYSSYTTVSFFVWLSVCLFFYIKTSLPLSIYFNYKCCSQAAHARGRWKISSSAHSSSPTSACARGSTKRSGSARRFLLKYFPGVYIMVGGGGPGLKNHK